MAGMFDLTGRVALVTGASRGIGEAIAKAYAQQGARVVVSSRKQEACDEVAKEIVAAGGDAVAIACHIGDMDALAAMPAGSLGRSYFEFMDHPEVVPGYLIQGGDPEGTGRGGPGYTIPLEPSSRPMERGVLAMARKSAPDSAGSQFFVLLARARELDGSWTAFGRVIAGMEVVEAIGRAPVDAWGRPAQPVVILNVEGKRRSQWEKEASP